MYLGFLIRDEWVSLLRCFGEDKRRPNGTILVDKGYEKAINSWIEKLGKQAWVGCDLDGTLAHFSDPWLGELHIGDPVPKMVKRIKKLLSKGVNVKIFTARANSQNPEVIKAIQEWTERHLGKRLDVTASKDYNCIYYFDDLAHQTIPNTGMTINDFLKNERILEKNA